MRRFVYMCLMLPTLSLSAAQKNQTRTQKKDLLLKSATVLENQEKSPSKDFQAGRCYIFDENKEALILEGVRYQVDEKNELVVDIKVSPEEQRALNTLSKKLSKKRHLVVSVNNEIVSAPLLKEELKDSGVQVSLEEKSGLTNLIQALS